MGLQNGVCCQAQLPALYCLQQSAHTYNMIISLDSPCLASTRSSPVSIQISYMDVGVHTHARTHTMVNKYPIRSKTIPLIL